MSTLQKTSVYAKRLRRNLQTCSMMVWPDVKEGVPGFTISLGEEVFRFVPASSIFLYDEEVDEAWLPFCNTLDSVAAAWRDCITANI